jgi:hypothetical protein
MAIIEGEANFTVGLDLGRKLLSERREFTIESLADAIHSAYCDRTAAFAGIRGEIHRRQHIEIARVIFEKGAPA